MDMTAVQVRTLDELMARAEERPRFRRELADDLREELDERLLRSLERWTGEEPFFVSKSRLADVHQRCDGLFLANHLGEQVFSYGFALALGKVVHKAVEVGVYARDLSEAELVERVMRRVAEEEGAFADYLALLDVIDRSALEAEAVRLTQVFRSMFPPLRKEWTPSVEMPLRADVAGGRVLLQARPDLSLGGVDQDEPLKAKRLLLELKTGPDRPEHDDDVRLYALVATLFFGVPPFRVATVHLGTGTWRAYDVTEDLLRSAARRTADGVSRAIELLNGSEPVLRPGAWCSWCPRSQTCPESTAARSGASAKGE